MNRKIITTMAFVAAAVGSFAQNAVVAGAAEAVSTQGATAGVTVGQLAVETDQNASGSMLLGIQQDFTGEVSAVATNPIQNVVVDNGGSANAISLDEYFMSNERLTYTASSTDNTVAKPVIEGLNLTLVLGKVGTATVTVVATTPSGEQIPLSFTVTVEPDEPSYINAKEELTALCDEATALLASVENLLDLTVREYVPYVALDEITKESQQNLENGSDEKKCAELSEKMKKAISDFKAVWTPTAIADISDEPTVSVVKRTIYVGNVQCGDVSLYDITGRRLYACRNARNTQITVQKAGAYVLMVCGKQQNVLIQ